MKITTFRGVQALRGLAALSVMLFHFRWNLNEVSPRLGDELFGWGATGVDLFFLISGFVITLSAVRSTADISGSLLFLRKRIVRILPAYYIILAITFLLSGAMSIFHYTDKTENLISALIFNPIYPNHAPFYVDDSGMYGVRWTLNYEVYFYLVMSIMVMLKRRWLWAGMYFTTTLIILPLFAWGDFTFQPTGYATDSALLGLLTNPMIFLFITGMSIGLVTPLLKSPPNSFLIASLFISLVICTYCFMSGYFTGHGLLSSGWIYALLLIFVILSENRLGKYIPKILVKVGDISFSLYLIHPLLNTGIGKRLEGIGVQPGYTRFILSILISCVLAWVSYRYIERPLIDRMRIPNRQRNILLKDARG